LIAPSSAFSSLDFEIFGGNPFVDSVFFLSYLPCAAFFGGRGVCLYRFLLGLELGMIFSFADKPIGTQFKVVM